MDFVISLQLIRLVSKISLCSRSRLATCFGPNDGLQEPNVKSFTSPARAHKLPHTRQNVFERFKLQSEFM